ncbi:hypothetical protein WR25_19048 isoform A [Diploscapter pachys]|uniref:RNA helicase n=2 Tax=Diploscapter pachys TaxID=2018661 RepID=A0A2A2JK68_9BILA|nr:hypothetical protein WR25_19048 isoform A [Diploscapter pachys]
MTSLNDELLSDDEEAEIAEDQENSQENEEESSKSGGSEDSSSEDEEDEQNEGDELEIECLRQTGESSMSASKKPFSELGLHSWLIQQLSSLHMKNATPVQEFCIPKILEGCDVLGCAKTGTGKTLAFALPILQQLAIDPYGIYALILTPTRELAFQIADQFNALGKTISLKCTVIVGGRSIIEQTRDVSARPHVIVATPGRLADILDNNSEHVENILKKIKVLVLDEADRMLDGQYNDSLKTIFRFLPAKRQTLLFSATITSAIAKLHKVSVRKPYFFEDVSEVATVDKLDQKYILCPQAVKDAYLVYVVKNFMERNEKSSVIVFSQTCHECQALAYMFEALGFHVGSLHSQIPQRQRLTSLSAFRSKSVRILICTDVASRGLDIPHVDLVVNHNIPQCPKTYVHRVGRSARAGRFGAAFTFVTQFDIVLLKAVEELIGKQLQELKVNEKNVTKYVSQVLVSKREAELKLEQQNFNEKKETNKRKELILAGLSEKEADKYLEKIRAHKRGESVKKPELKPKGTKKGKGADLSKVEKKIVKKKK